MRKKLKMAREMLRGRRALQSSVGQLLSLLLARHVVYSIFSGPKPSASHALVDFGDEGTAIIPFSRIVDGSSIDGRCRVKWPDGKEYDAALAFAGKSIITRTFVSQVPRAVITFTILNYTKFMNTSVVVASQLRVLM